MHGHFVGVLEVAADRKPHCNAGDADTERLEEASEVDGGGFSLDVGIGREDHFSHTVTDPSKQALDLQVVWTDTLKG